MNYDLEFLYKQAYGKDAEPFDGDIKDPADFIFTLLVSEACDLVDTKTAEIENIKFSHIFLYSLFKAGYDLDDIYYNILVDRDYDYNIESRLFQDYSNDKLYESLDKEYILNKYFDKDEDLSEFEFVPTDCLITLIDYNIGDFEYEKCIEMNCLKKMLDFFKKNFNGAVDFYDLFINKLLTDEKVNEYNAIYNADSIYLALKNMLAETTINIKNIRDGITNNAQKNFVEGWNKHKEEMKNLPKKNGQENLLSRTTHKKSTESKLYKISSLPSLIIGQNKATETICDEILLSAQGLTSLGNTRPIASFLLTGPSGVGKTETAKAVANLVADGQIYIIDMTQFKSKDDVARLTGSPAGYVGYGDANLLCEFIKNHPNGVILFDEFEKCHPDCRNILMRILDEGKFTNAKNETFSLTNNIIFCTSNYTANTSKIGFNSDKESAERKMLTTNDMPKELIGRFDAVVEYKFLSKNACKQIAKKMLNKQIDDYNQINEFNLTIKYEDSILDLIIADADTAMFGARDLSKSIKKLVIIPLSRYLLKHKPSSVTLIVTPNGVIEESQALNTKAQSTGADDK